MASGHRPREGSDLPRPTVRLEVSGTSPDEAMATLPGIYAGRHWHSTETERSYSYRYTAVGDEALTLRRSALSGHLRGEVHVGGDYVVHWLTSGRIVLDTLGDPVALPTMQPNLSPEGEHFVFEATDYDARLVHLDRDLVHDVAGELTGTAVTALRLDVRRRPDAAALVRWRDALVGATAVVGGRETEPLAWQRATRAVAVAFVGLWPPQVDDARAPLSCPSRACLRAALDFVHAHLDEPLTVGRIAEAAGLSPRGTQETFRRLLGTTPLRYVQQLRLDRVRADLTVARPGTADVATVARRWGFVHVGRFSGAYRARFGEYPRATLHR